MSEPVRLYFDIESTRLEADWGVCLCIGYRLGSGKIEIPTIHDFPHKDMLDDKGLVKFFANEVWPKADIAIGHYLKFDIPFINTRLLVHGLPTLAPVHQIDTWAIARYKMKLSSNRLANVQDVLHVKHAKTSVDKDHWRKAMIGDKKSLRYIVEHCKFDILVLEEVYEKMGNLIVEPRRFRGDHQCPSCGSGNVQARGRQLTKQSAYQRFHCQKCGTWSRNRTQKSMELV